MPDLLPDPFGGDNDPFVDLYNNLGPLADPSSPFPAPQPPQQQLQPTPVHHHQPPQVFKMKNSNPLKNLFRVLVHQMECRRHNLGVRFTIMSLINVWDNSFWLQLNVIE